MKFRDAKLQVNEKNLSHRSLYMYIAFIFSEYITMKVCEHIFFQEM